MSVTSEAHTWLYHRWASHQDPAWRGSRPGFGHVHPEVVGWRERVSRRPDKAPCQDVWEPGTEGWSAGQDRGGQQEGTGVWE